MASSLGYSEINSNQTLSKLKTNKHTLTGKKKITSAETERLFKQLSPGDDDDDLPNLLEPPKISSNDVLENDSSLTRNNDPVSFGNTTIPQLKKSDNCVSTKEEFSNLQEPYVPYTTMASNDGSANNNNNQELMERINYMIFLLEEQKNEKTGSVHEEMVLYSFLGVFVIFIVDSFARAGKYSR